MPESLPRPRGSVLNSAGMIAPLALFGGLVFLARRSAKQHEEEAGDSKPGDEERPS